MSHIGLDFEVSAAAKVLARDMARITTGQEVLIYADSESDSLVVSGIAKAIHNEGAKVAVMWYPSPPGVGETTTPYLPTSLPRLQLRCSKRIC